MFTYSRPKRRTNRPVSPRALVAMAVLTGGLPAIAGPTGARAVEGQIDVRRQGAFTRIQASDRAIINYRSFGIERGETVRFVQPGASASVLNRVVGSIPSRIDGQLVGNGRVYLVNPAGVTVGPTGVVRASAFYAAAANMSNADFMNGIDRFTDADGAVVNYGQILAHDVALFGNSVANHGVIDAGEGAVVMAAGQRLIVGDLFGHVHVSVPADPARNGLAGIDPDGVVPLYAGDIAGLSLWHSGATNAARVHAEAAGASALVQGEMRARRGNAGGTIAVHGHRVGVSEAILDASAPRGGGEINLGSRPGRTASVLHTTPSSTLRADATRAGTGGQVIMHAGDEVIADGWIRARGSDSNRGGRVSVSGTVSRVDLRRVAAAGDGGVIDIDHNGSIEIAGGSTPESPRPSRGALFGSSGGEGILTIHEAEIESAAGDVSLLADDAVFATGVFDFGSNPSEPAVFSLAEGRNLTIRTRNSAGQGAGGIDLVTLAEIDRIDVLRGDLLLETGTAGGALEAPLLVGALDVNGTATINASGVANLSGAIAEVTDLAVSGSQIRLGGLFINARGPVSFAGPVVLDSDLAIQVLGGGPGTPIEFLDALDSGTSVARSLAVVGAEADLRFAGNVGLFSRLRTVIARAESVETKSVLTLGTQQYSAETIGLDGVLFDASEFGFIEFDGDAILRTDTAIRTAGATGQSAIFGGSINSEDPSTPRALLVAAGQGEASIAGNAGQLGRLRTFVAEASRISVASVLTTGTQQYDAPLTEVAGPFLSAASSGTIHIDGDLVLNNNLAIRGAGGAGNSISIGGQVDSAAAATFALLIDAGLASLAIGGNAGTTTPLRTVQFNAGVIEVGTVVSTGDQRYTGATTLRGGSIRSTGPGSIEIAGPATLAGDTTIETAGRAGDSVATADIDGPFFIGINSGDASTSIGNAGATGPLSGFDAESGSFTADSLSAATVAVRTPGDAVFNGPLAATGDSLEITAGRLSLSHGLDAAGQATIASSRIESPVPISAGRLILMPTSDGNTVSVMADIVTTDGFDVHGVLEVDGDAVTLDAGDGQMRFFDDIVAAQGAATDLVLLYSSESRIDLVNGEVRMRVPVQFAGDIGGTGNRVLGSLRIARTDEGGRGDAPIADVLFASSLPDDPSAPLPTGLDLTQEFGVRAAETVDFSGLGVTVFGGLKIQVGADSGRIAISDLVVLGDLSLNAAGQGGVIVLSGRPGGGYADRKWLVSALEGARGPASVDGGADVLVGGNLSINGQLVLGTGLVPFDGVPTLDQGPFFAFDDLNLSGLDPFTVNGGVIAFNLAGPPDALPDTPTISPPPIIPPPVSPPIADGPPPLTPATPLDQTIPVIGLANALPSNNPPAPDDPANGPAAAAREPVRRAAAELAGLVTVVGEDSPIGVLPPSVMLDLQSPLANVPPVVSADRLPPAALDDFVDRWVLLAGSAEGGQTSTLPGGATTREQRLTQIRNTLDNAWSRYQQSTTTGEEQQFGTFLRTQSEDSLELEIAERIDGLVELLPALQLTAFESDRVRRQIFILIRPSSIGADAFEKSISGETAQSKMRSKPSFDSDHEVSSASSTVTTSS